MPRSRAVAALATMDGMGRHPGISLHGGHSGEACRHARGTLDAVVAAAAAGGFTHFGISEHAPRSGRENLYPEEIAAGDGPEHLEAAYARLAATRFDEVSRLAGGVHLLLGLETEVVPVVGWEGEMADLRVRHRPDYVVGSVHHVAGIPIDFDPAGYERAVVAHGGDEESLHLAYYALQLRVIEALRPEVLGHLDLPKKFSPRPPYTPRIAEAVARNLVAARDAGCLVEVNAAGLRRGLGEPYPSPGILRLAADLGVPITFGDDSHGPDQVGACLAEAADIARACGYGFACALERVPASPSEPPRRGTTRRVAVPL